MSVSRARLGMLSAVLAFAHAAPTATVGNPLVSEIKANPAAASDSRGEWFELSNPAGETIYLRDIAPGDDGGDRYRIETDLLILPQHFRVLASRDSSLIESGPGMYRIPFDTVAPEAVRMGF